MGDVLLGEAVLVQIVQRLVLAADPDRIILNLFGSRARGGVRSNSDYDLLVIRESEEPRYSRSAPLYAALADIDAEVEVMVYTSQEVREWSSVPQAFVTTAIREGKLLYERKN